MTKACFGTGRLEPAPESDKLSTAVQGVQTALQNQQAVLQAHARKLADAKAKYPKDSDLQSRHAIQVRNGDEGEAGGLMDGLVGITADLFVLDTKHDVLALRDALSTAYQEELQFAIFELDEHLQLYKQHPQKHQIKIERATALDLLPDLPLQLPRAGTKGFLGCASDFLRLRR